MAYVRPDRSKGGALSCMNRILSALIFLTIGSGPTPPADATQSTNSAPLGRGGIAGRVLDISATFCRAHRFNSSLEI